MPEQNKTILVVEDDDATAEWLADVIRREGHQAATAANGRLALDYLRGRPRPDLILLDMMMPVLDGWQFRARQREDPGLAEIPVIVLSADGSVSQKAATLGAADYLKKPVEIEHLLDTIKRHC